MSPQTLPLSNIPSKVFLLLLLLSVMFVSLAVCLRSSIPTHTQPQMQIYRDKLCSQIFYIWRGVLDAYKQGQVCNAALNSPSLSYGWSPAHNYKKCFLSLLSFLPPPITHCVSCNRKGLRCQHEIFGNSSNLLIGIPFVST